MAVLAILGHPMFIINCVLIYIAGLSLKVTDDIFDERILSHWLDRRGEMAAGVICGVVAGVLGIYFMTMLFGFLLWGGMIFSAPIRRKLDNTLWWIIYVGVLIGVFGTLAVLNPFEFTIEVGLAFLYVLGVVYIMTVLNDLEGPPNQMSKSYDWILEYDVVINNRKVLKKWKKRIFRRNWLTYIMFERRWIGWVMVIPLIFIYPQFIGYQHILLFFLFLEGYSLLCWLTPKIHKKWPPAKSEPLSEEEIFPPKKDGGYSFLKGDRFL